MLQAPHFFEFREPKRRAQAPDDRVHHVGNDIVCMVELDVGEKGGVAGDVGNHETCGFGFRKHLAVPAELRLFYFQQPRTKSRESDLVSDSERGTSGQPAARIVPTPARCTFRSFGSMTPRFLTILNWPLLAWAMYMFMRT